MNEHDGFHQLAAQLEVIIVLRQVKHDPESISQKLQALVARIEVVRLEAPQQELDTIGQKGIVVILHHNGFEDLLIRGADERFENEHDGDHVFILLPGESKHRAAVGAIVQDIGDALLIGSDASDRDAVRGI